MENNGYLVKQRRLFLVQVFLPGQILFFLQFLHDFPLFAAADELFPFLDDPGDLLGQGFLDGDNPVLGESYLVFVSDEVENIYTLGLTTIDNFDQFGIGSFFFDEFFLDLLLRRLRLEEPVLGNVFQAFSVIEDGFQGKWLHDDDTVR